MNTKTKKTGYELDSFDLIINLNAEKKVYTQKAQFTPAQMDYVNILLEQKDSKIVSTGSQMMKRLSKYRLSQAIDAMKNGKRVLIFTPEYLDKLLKTV